jgi:hypothetical protein
MKTNITNESDYVSELSKSKEETQLSNINPDFSIIQEEVKKEIDNKEQEIYSFLQENNDFKSYSESEKDERFQSVISKWNELKDLVKKCKINLALNGLEINFLENKLHSNIDYDYETIFYAVHLKKHLLNNLPSVKASDDFKVFETLVLISDCVLLQHILTKLTVKGLNKSSLAFANICKKLSEVIVLYNFYENMSMRLSKSIQEWNMELSKDEVSFLQKEVLKQEIANEIQEGQGGEMTQPTVKKVKKQKA